MKYVEEYEKYDEIEHASFRSSAAASQPSCPRKRGIGKMPGKHNAAVRDRIQKRLAEIEAGTVGKLSLGTLSRIAHALGKQIACSLVEKVA